MHRCQQQIYARLATSDAFYTVCFPGVPAITPPETALIIADIAIKAAGVMLVSLDITSGSVIITGTVSQTDAAVLAILDFVSHKLDFAVCDLTKTSYSV